MANLTDEPLSGLLSLQNSLNSKILDLEIADGDQTAKIKILTDRLNPIKVELKRREDSKSSEKESKPDSNESMRFADNQHLREMKSQLEQIPMFGPGSELSIFLASLNNCYVVFVKDNIKFEKNFMLTAKGRLAQAFQTRVNNQSPSIETFDALKKYLEEHHGSRKTIFQALDEIYDIEPSGGEMRDYAIKLENAGNDLHIKMADKFKKAGKTLDARAVMDLMIAQVYVRNLRSCADIMCYNSIVNSLSSCWDVTSVATHAQSYLERVVKVDELETPNAFFGGQKKMKPAPNREDNEEKKTKKRGICYKWRDTGKCRWDKCPYDHPGRDESSQNEVEELPGQYVSQPVPGFLEKSPTSINSSDNF